MFSTLYGTFFHFKCALKCCLQFVSIWTSLKFCHLVMGLPFPKQALVFMCLQYKSFENKVGNREIAHNEQFLLFPQCFLPVWRTFCHFHHFWNCHPQTLSVWKSLKFVVWEWVKRLSFFLPADMQGCF